MIKVLHTSDIHIGRKFFYLQEKADDYRAQILRTFIKIADLAKDEQVKLLLIAGDLFDSNYMYGRAVASVQEIFRDLAAAGIAVCIFPGDHDSFNDHSVYVSLHKPPNVILLTKENNTHAFTDLDISIVGLNGNGSDTTENALNYDEELRKSKFKIGMAHGLFGDKRIADSGIAALDVDKVARLGLDYLAIGHDHSFQEMRIGKTSVCYSGSPEPLDIGQKSSGDVVLVSLQDDQGVEIKPVHIGSKKTGVLKIDISPLKSIDSINEAIMELSDPDLILEVILTGQRGINLSLDRQEMEDKMQNRFFNLRVLDDTQLEINTYKEPEFLDRTIGEKFSRIVNEKIAQSATREEKQTFEEVLRLGFPMLQGRSEVDR